ncbi:DUF4190 domain-containing protein [Demequina sp. NBRC 110054]|uniref:DUF4190 domain-containing protein n=1 Tax=Demequina sp. NBRC 110054 TaxID=1570343 RepID=UPI0009FDDDBD|nr:DUF4190 domain-containing protein [Demequina sp. NBRC 110054]
MADDERRNPDEPWVAPPLGSDGASSGAYTDPFAAPTEQFPTQASSASVPPPPYGPGAPTSDPFAQQPGRIGQPTEASDWAQPYGQPYAAAAMPGGSRTDKNWMGLTSLVLGLVGVSLGGVILGHMGLSAVKRGEADNRGVALAGTIIGWISTAFFLIWLAFVAVWYVAGTESASTLGDAEYTWEDSTPEASESATADPYADLAQPGDGVFGYDEAARYFIVYVDGNVSEGTCLAPSYTSGYDLDVVDCSEEHVGEIYYTAPLADLMVDGDVTSDESFAAYGEACDAAFSPYLDDSGSPVTNQWLFGASDDGVLSADDTLMCVASDEFGSTTGTLAGSGGQIY